MKSHPRHRRGRANPLVRLLLGPAILVAILWISLSYNQREKSGDTESLTLYCAAGLRFPVEEIAQQYEQEFGIPIELQFGGSNTLLNQLAVNKFSGADLYLAADAFYTQKAIDEGLALDSLEVAYQRPVIAVRKGNPKNIQSLADLLRQDVSVVMASPDQAAVGRATQTALEKVQTPEGNMWTRLESHVTEHGVFKPTVNDAATDILLGTIDAGIVWDSTVAMPAYADDLIAISAPELEVDPQLISIAVLRSTETPTAAFKFARYLTASDRGLRSFAKYGTKPIEGDRWEEHPQVTFYCGAVNRKAVEKVIAEFETREGVTVNTTFDGCGTLTGRMAVIANQDPDAGFPDLYMACDLHYLENVRPWFQDSVNVSDAKLVLAVPKGSTKVTTLADILKPGVRVAIGQPEQCTIGALTRNLLKHEKMYEELQKKQQQEGEVVVEKPSSALLVPDVLTGHVDVAIAYNTDMGPHGEKLDSIEIQSPLNEAIQPLSIARSSEQKQLIGRLYRHIATARESFEAAGFHYRLTTGLPERE